MIGRTISQYRILEELGRGGMGVVYKAHDTKLDRPAALKIIKPELLEDEDNRQRFLREAHSAAAVTHPFIASIYDAGEADGTLFIAMEFVEGKTLRALLSKGPLHIPETQQYAAEIAEGLATAHQAHLVHRDLKPDNVMVAENGHVKILDFGLAKVVEKRDEAATVTLGKAEKAEVTTQGAVLGTPAYMSPEQVRGEPVDSRSDIFSFGSTVYDMVTGRTPFWRATLTETLASILRDEPPSPNDSNPAVPGELNRIISRCLHKRPEETKYFRFVHDPKMGDFEQYHLYCDHKTAIRPGPPDHKYHHTWRISGTSYDISSDKEALERRRRAEEAQVFEARMRKDLIAEGMRLCETEEGLVKMPDSG